MPLLPYPAPPHDETGELTGPVNMLVDITTQRKRSEEQLRLLLDELNHRVKNTLAAVQSIFAQTFPDSEGDARAKDAFEGRVLALSKACDLLTKRRLATASQVPVAELHWTEHDGPPVEEPRRRDSGHG